MQFPKIQLPSHMKVQHESLPLDDGQITHLIHVRLKICLYDFFRGGSGFPVFSPFLLACLQ